MTEEPKQLSIFQFDDRIRREIIGGVTRFSLLDAFKYYGNSSNPTMAWKTVLNRLRKQGFDETKEILDWRPAADNSGKPTPMVTFKTFLRIAQVTDFKDWEFLRSWMAEVAHERLEEEFNPELGLKREEKRYLDRQRIRGMSKEEAFEQLQNRRDGKAEFKQMTDAIRKVCGNVNYGHVVNTEYAGLFNALANDLRKALHTDSIRDALPPLQYSYIRTAEAGIREVMKRADTMTNEQVYAVMAKVCKPLGDHLQEICNMLGIDHITGKPLLNTGDQL